MRRCRIAFDPAKPDPRDATIQNHLDKGEWKPALRLVELQGRKDKSDKIFINKSLIKLVWADDVFEKMEALKHLERFLVGGTPIQKGAMLAAIDYSMTDLARSSKPQMLFTMWERACNAMPKDGDMLNAWYLASCQRLDFEAARKIALRAFKIVRDKHSCRWRAIVSCYLDSSFGPNLVVARLSHGLGLALVKLSLDEIPLVDNTGSENTDGSKLPETLPVLNKSLPSVQTPTDLRTLLLIYRTHNMDEESLAVLNSKTTGLRSPIGGGTWRLALEELKTLKKQGKASEGWGLCYQLLCEAGKIPLDAIKESPYGYGETGDDLTVWRNAIDDIFALKDPANLSKFQALLDCQELKQRHRLLAAIYLSILADTDKDIFPDYKLTPTIAIQNYLDKYFGTGIAYSDLRSAAGKMPESQRITILEQVRKMVRGSKAPRGNEKEFRIWMHKHLTELKLTYTLEVSMEENLKMVDKLESFAALCVGTYIMSLHTEKKLAITERRTGDEAAVLGACTLIHLDAHKPSMRVRAILLLETLLENSPHHSGGLLMLTRLHAAGGCWDLAIRHFMKLELKTIQLFTDAWVMTSRVASIFPYRTLNANKDMGSLLSRCAKYAESRANTIHQLADKHQKERNTIGVCDTYTFLNMCNTSISRATVLAELSRYYYRNRIGDCFGEETVLGSLSTIEKKSREGGYTDVRSFEGFPNYEAIGGVSLAMRLQTGPVTNQIWVEVEDLLFKWRRWAQKQEWQQLSAQGYMDQALELMGRLKSLHLSTKNPELMPGLTRQERWVAVIITQMTSFQSVTAAFRREFPVLKDATVDAKVAWLKQHFVKYENSFRIFQFMMRHFMDAVLEEKAFIENPVDVFYRCPWDVLHTYYKFTEIFMFIPGFILERLSFAREFRNIVSGTTVSDTDHHSTTALDKSILETWLRDFLKEASTIIKNWNTAAQTAQIHFKDFQGIRELVVRANGYDEILENDALRNNLHILFGENWSTPQALKMTRGWRDALAGIALEDLKHWRTKRWPKIVEKYMESL